jgi:hypothetical protein
MRKIPSRSSILAVAFKIPPLDLSLVHIVASESDHLYQDQGLWRSGSMTGVMARFWARLPMTVICCGNTCDCGNQVLTSPGELGCICIDGYLRGWNDRCGGLSRGVSDKIETPRGFCFDF